MKWQTLALVSMTAAAAAVCIGVGVSASTPASSANIQPTQTITPTSSANSSAAKAAPTLIRIERTTLGPGPEHVLFYEDANFGQSVYLDALNQLGWAYTFTNNPATFAAELGMPGYTHVISAQQSSGGAQPWESPLISWISNHPGNTVLITDWRVSDPPPGYLSSLGFSYGPVINDDLILPTADPCFTGLSDADLFNPGWGIYSYTTLGGLPIATNGAGDPAIARNGNIFFNGFLGDTFLDQNLGVEYVIRELLKCPVDQGACCVKGNCAVVSREACEAFGAPFYPGLTCDQIDCKKCIGDLNGDGEVNALDLLILLANWGTCPQPDVCTDGFVCVPPYEDYPCGDPADDCVCLHDFNGGISCGQHGGCGTPCSTGSCPAGMVCAVDTCCGQPICLNTCPSTLAGESPESVPPRPGTATSARPAGTSGHN